MIDRGGDVDLVDDEFERLGRQAGAELREQPPDDGPTIVLRTANRRRSTVGIVAAGVTVAVVLAGLVWADLATPRRASPIATVPPAPTPTPTPAPDPIVTTTVSPHDRRTQHRPMPCERQRPARGAPWRTRHRWHPNFPQPQCGPAPMSSSSETTRPSVRSCRRCPLPRTTSVRICGGQSPIRPPTLTSSLQWTGSAVLATTDEGEVYSYDPVLDRGICELPPMSRCPCPERARS